MPTPFRGRQEFFTYPLTWLSMHIQLCSVKEVIFTSQLRDHYGPFFLLPEAQNFTIGYYQELSINVGLIFS